MPAAWRRVMRAGVNISFGGPPGFWQLLFDVERGGRMERLTTDIDLE
jgi:hypothetical protein